MQNLGHFVLCKNLHKFIELIQTNYLFGLNSTAKSASKPKANCGSRKYIPCERNQSKKQAGLKSSSFFFKITYGCIINREQE